MPFAPAFSLSILVTGLIIIPVCSAIPRLRSAVRFVVPGVVGLAAVAVVATGFEPVGLTNLSRWRPLAFFETYLALQADPLMWPLAVGSAVALLGVSLVRLSRRAQPSALTGLVPLGILITVLGSLWGTNPLTVLVFWGGFDLIWMMGMAAADVPARRVALAGGVGVLSLLALWVGAALTEASGGGHSWHLFSPTELGRDLLLIAGVLRIGLYPLHMTLPLSPFKSSYWTVSLLMRPVQGWAFFARLASAAGGTFLWGDWLSTLAMLTMVVGGALAWTRRGRREVAPWAAMAAAGGLLWGATLAGSQALPILVAGGTAWVLGVTLIYLSRGWSKDEPWWSIPSLVGGSALLGGPLTLGMLSSAAVFGGSALEVAPYQKVLYVVGQALLAAALFRFLLRSVVQEEPSRPLELAARGTGTALLLGLVLVGGVHPPLLLRGLEAPSLVSLIGSGGVVGWGMWAFAVAGGAVLFWAERYFRQHIESLLGLVHDLLSLGWFMRLFLGGQERVLKFLQATAELMEGAGAVLWSLAVFVLILLLAVGG